MSKKCIWIEQIMIISIGVFNEYVGAKDYTDG